MVDIKNAATTAIRSLVISGAIHLCTQNGKCTTFEIKQLIRATYPKLYITQGLVSETMIDFSVGGYSQIFDWTDTGIFRVYSLSLDVNNIISNSFPSKITKRKMSKSDIVRCILTTPKVTEIIWIKNNGKERAIQDVSPSGMDTQGYIDVRLDDGTFKKVNPRKIVSAVINNEVLIAT